MKKTLFATLTLLTATASAPALEFSFDGKTNGGFSLTAAPAALPYGIALAGAPARVSPFSGETVAPGIFEIPFSVAARRAPLTAEEREAEVLFILGKMETVYSHLENKQRIFGFSYDAVKSQLLSTVRTAASDTEYRTALRDFIRLFSDPHLGVYFYDGAAQPQPQQPPAVTNTLTEDGILITRVSRLTGEPEEFEKGLGESLELAKKARALVVDMRGNHGGNDGYTRTYISFLIDKPIPAGKVTIKISSETLARYGELEEDPENPGWTPFMRGMIQPRGDSPFKGPVAMLIDGGCVSSCEGSAVMFKFSGMAKLYGETTMGSSGYPVTIPLPHSSGAVRVPTWIQLQPDNTPIEDHGIEPHIRVESRKALEAALTDIRAALQQ
ncbi:MAG: S41 family peptidase [Elusimicrobiales bacterium]